MPDHIYDEIRKELDGCKNPLFFFDDDPDGTAAFMLLYRYKQEGRGIPIKSAPMLDLKFLRMVEEAQPDKIFVLDVPMIDQGFLDKMRVPVIWIDHHGPFKRDRVKYYNPLNYREKDNTCTTGNCYHIVKLARPQDLWIAMIGIVGDWQFPKELMEEFRKQYPDLLPKKIKTPDAALFGSEIGKLVKIISFMLKGSMADVNKCLQYLSTIKSPHEILRQETPEGRYIYNKAQSVWQDYDRLLEHAKSKKSRDKVLVFTYDGSNSFTKELSNEMLYLFPKKIIVVGRKKGGEYKLSFRSSTPVRPILQKALAGIDGYGGGHENACGGCVKEKDWERFLEQFREEVKKGKR